LKTQARVDGIHHVNLRAGVAEIALLKKFYCDIVGLRVGTRPQLRIPGFWLYAGDAPVLHLTEAPPGEVSAPTAEQKSALNHVAFRCAGFKATLSRLSEARVSYAINVLPEIGETQVVFKDPLQLGVELTFRTEEEGEGGSALDECQSSAEVFRNFGSLRC
jgi:catechol 2,3-dioxygenase-like lactoylglutathione lyase family enzyme